MSSILFGTLPLEFSNLIVDDELAGPGRTSKLRPKTPELDDERGRRFARRGSHLTGSILERTNGTDARYPRILDSPVTTLGDICPDIGMPLCTGYQAPSLNPATEEDELIRSESHGTRELMITEDKTDSRQDSVFLRKLHQLLAEYNLSRSRRD